MHKQGILNAAVLLFPISILVIMSVGCAGSQTSPTQLKEVSADSGDPIMKYTNALREATELSADSGNPIMEHTNALREAIRYRSCGNVKTLLDSGYVDIYARTFLGVNGAEGPVGQLLLLVWPSSVERKKYSKEIEEQEFCILNEYKRRGFNFAEQFLYTTRGGNETQSLVDTYAWLIVFMGICRASDHVSCLPAAEVITLHPIVTKRSVSYVIQTSDKEAVFASFDTVCRAGLRSDQLGFRRIFDVGVRNLLREAGARVPESCTTF